MIRAKVLITHRISCKKAISKCWSMNTVSFKKTGETIQIAGVADLLTGKPNLDLALEGSDSNGFTLLLAHCPDFAEQARKKPVHLQLSGHSHGGQVRLPIVGALSKPLGAKKYVMGLYEVPNSNLHVYTTRGIGTTFLPIRFLCRPEITVITLQVQNP
ncbi:metallophosphoesterase [Paenibacillus hexagrammi]|uniref:Metallophosphoesterase n=1 Tax=Paenibacillus hexagrammi TaxID=2908839 RepID=A0ABY3SRY3_9BACL|nr:hypothetical protein [Paenibacillus sp. YPD9-1]UJF35916.1 hypothetical protein L0M14_13020 [Paenibacillus sp. YPD9-1]